MSPDAERGGARPDLERLARARGVAVAYLGADGRRRVATDETLVAVLAALGDDLSSPADAAEALRARRSARRSARRAAPTVLVAWDGVVAPLPRLGRPGGKDGRNQEGAGSLQVHLEEGGAVPLDPKGGGRLPEGVHELVDADGERQAMVISAPAIAPPPRPPLGWGLFAPTYAIADRRHRPTGDLTALARLGRLAAERGASHLATLPLLAEWSIPEGGPPGQQPYAPLSRWWWNEGYLDLERLPELGSAEGAAALARARAGLGAAPVRRARDGRPLADVASAAAAARPALELAATELARQGGPRRAAYEAFVSARPDLDRYAAFRVAGELAGPDLARWPAAWRHGRLEGADLPATALSRHRFAQFAMDAQLGEVAGQLSAVGCGLVLDLPVGCAAGGYDPWAVPDAFATGASVGAPPDTFFTAGQNWGFPPPHPETDRAAGYPLLRRVLAHHAAHGAVVRIDHVLGWARLWWVPSGLEPKEGAYVRYPTEELLAVACLEASRGDCALAGEDLGTVPVGLRPALRRHGVAGMGVAVFDLEAAPHRRLRPRSGTVAYVGTHDTATFAAFATGADLSLRAGLGLAPADPGEMAAARAERAGVIAAVTDRLLRAGRLAPGGRDDPASLLGAVLDELGESDADLVVVAVDDLLGELEPQNVPGTTTEHDNFSRTLAADLDQLGADGRVGDLLARLDAARRRSGSGVDRDRQG